MYHLLLLYWYIGCNLGILVLENIPVGYGILTLGSPLSSLEGRLVRSLWEIFGAISSLQTEARRPHPPNTLVKFL
jgi:hypothetical protein